MSQRTGHKSSRLHDADKAVSVTQYVDLTQRIPLDEEKVSLLPWRNGADLSFEADQPCGCRRRRENRFHRTHAQRYHPFELLRVVSMMIEGRPSIGPHGD